MAHDRNWTDRDLEAIATFLWDATRDMVDECSHCKSYDPLTISEGTAWSYVFDLDDGGRSHAFTDNSDLYRQLLQEARRWAEEALGQLRGDDTTCGEKPLRLIPLP